MADISPKKNEPFVFYTFVRSQLDIGLFQANPTIAAGDFKVSIDGGALNNPGTIPAVSPGASKQIEISLSAAEMNGDVITVLGSDQADAEWYDVFLQWFTDDRYDFGPNLLLNPGFETGGTGGNFNGGAEIDDGTSDVFTSWANYYVNDPAGNKIEATATVHAGSVAVKMTRTTDYTTMRQSVVVTPGARYGLPFWTRGDGAVAGRYGIEDLSSGTPIIEGTSTGVSGVIYTQVLVYFTAPCGCSSVRISFIGPPAPGVCYFDDISLTMELPAVVAITADAVWDEVSTGHIDAGKAGQQMWTDLDAVLADTNELQTDDTPAAIAALNDLSAAQVNTEADTALSDYDAPTKAELDSGLAALNDPTVAVIADGVWDELRAAHVIAGSFGAVDEWADVALGAGTTPLEVTVTDGVNPLDGAEVDVTTTATHTTPIASGYTDAFGKVTFHLDPGTYYIWVQHSGYNGTNPTEKVVP